MMSEFRTTTGAPMMAATTPTVFFETSRSGQAIKGVRRQCAGRFDFVQQRRDRCAVPCRKSNKMTFLRRW